MSNNDFRVFLAALRHDFLAFTDRGVRQLNQGISFRHNWHLEAVAWELEKVMKGETRRLIINLPPRSLKSLMVSVLLPAYWLGHDPRKKIFGISYGGELAAKHARDCQSIMQTGWYRRAFPRAQITRIADSSIYMDQQGFRKATSINATLTGLGGDCFIIDDPLKPIDAQSDALRSAANDWLSSTMLSRLDDKAKGVIIIVMQRVHQYDLTGYVLEKSPKDWVLLNLPAIAEDCEEIQVGPGLFHRRQAGEVLHPEREPLHVLERVR